MCLACSPFVSVLLTPETSNPQALDPACRIRQHSGYMLVILGPTEALQRVERACPGRWRQPCTQLVGRQGPCALSELRAPLAVGTPGSQSPSYTLTSHIIHCVEILRSHKCLLLSTCLTRFAYGLRAYHCHLPWTHHTRATYLISAETALSSSP